MKYNEAFIERIQEAKTSNELKKIWQVNLSEIDDEQFKVSEDDKRLNKEFYGDNL